MQIRDVIIVGAGPAGLAAGIAAKRSGLDFSIVEKGVLVNSIFKFPVNMVFFTTPELLEIGGLPLVSPFEKPTRQEALKYYRRVVDAFELPIEFEEQVFAIEREQGPDRSEIFAVETRSAKGVRRIRHGRNVVLAIGYFDHPNFIGVPGEDLPHVFHYYDEPHGYYRKRVVIVGGGNSACQAALYISKFANEVNILIRREALKFVAANYLVENIGKTSNIKVLPFTEVVNATGEKVLEKVTLKNGRTGEECTVSAKALFIYIGQRPGTGWLNDIVLKDEKGFIITGRELMKDKSFHTFWKLEIEPFMPETSVPGIFASGDVRSTALTGISSAVGPKPARWRR